jgi:hypothetical protein
MIDGVQQQHVLIIYVRPCWELQQYGADVMGGDIGLYCKQ